MRRSICLAGTEERYGMSRALVCGQWCFVSGTVGYDHQNLVLPKDVRTQAENAFAHIQAVLQAAGFALRDVVRVQYTLSDREHMDLVLPVIRTVFSDIRPAATMVIADLVEVDMKIEIEVTALKEE